MEWQVIGIIIGAALVGLLLLGIPLAVGIGIIGAIAIMLLTGVTMGLEAVGIQLWISLTNYHLLTIMFFVALGEFMLAAGVTQDMFNFASKWLNRLPSGLAIVSIGTCALFATCSGSTTAAVATVGKLSIPEMLKRGYNKRLATGTIAAAGGLAHLIPPSILAVVYAAFNEIPVGQMLMAGVIPGFLLAGAYALVAVTWGLTRPGDAPREAAVAWKERLMVTRKMWAPALIVFSVLGLIFMGITTVTEASATGAITAFILLVFRRRSTWYRFFTESLRQTVLTTTFILFIIVGAKLFSWVLNYFMIPHHLVGIIVDLSVSPLTLIIIFMLLYLFLGMFIDTMGQIFITMPIVIPIVIALDFSPIWFGILFLLCVEVGQISPPFGMIPYIIKGIAPTGITLSDVLRGYLTSYFLADLAVLALLLTFPVLALWLPGIMY